MNIIDAAYATVHEYPGGSESLGPRVGLPAAVLRSKVDPRNGTQQLSLAEAERIMALTGDFRMLTALAHQHGLLVVAPDQDDSGFEMEALQHRLGARAASGVFAPQAPVASGAEERISEHELRATRTAERALQAVVAKMAQRREGLADRAGRVNADAGSCAAPVRLEHACPANERL